MANEFSISSDAAQLEPPGTARSVARCDELAALVKALGKPLACLDLETTGGNTVYDRITEVGMVRIDADGRTECWSSLLDPQRTIPAQITALTGIDEQMVSGAPTFCELRDALLERLAGHIIVAHNARFDLGFLKQSFRREGVSFQPPTLCSVRLSRALFPGERGHGLDALMRRLGLECSARHRALGDARVVADFLQRLAGTRLDELLAACRAQWHTPSLPPNLPEGTLERIPERPGVYLIYAENGVLLYVGKSVQLRRRVLDHFRNDHRAQREMRLAQQARHIEWIETAGELSALLLESRLVKERQPVLNRRLRRSRELCTIEWTFGAGVPPRVVCGEQVVPGDSFGAFRSPREALSCLRRLASEQGLCDIRLGLQSGSGPCFGHQIKRCRGACVGREPHAQHDLRLAQALQSIRVARWPYAGPICVAEGSEGRCSLHAIDQWIYLGETSEAADLGALLEGRRPAFDIDTYRILLRFLSNARHRRSVRILAR